MDSSTLIIIYKYIDKMINFDKIINFDKMINFDKQIDNISARLTNVTKRHQKHLIYFSNYQTIECGKE